MREMGGAPRNPAPGTTFGCGLSNHQAATARMHLVEQKNENYRRVPTPLGSTSPFSDYRQAESGGAEHSLARAAVENSAAHLLRGPGDNDIQNIYEIDKSISKIY